MNSLIQTLAALGLVGVAAIWLVRRAFDQRRKPGCGAECGAVSPEMKRLQARLKKVG